jgi:hypothetical protein
VHDRWVGDWSGEPTQVVQCDWTSSSRGRGPGDQPGSMVREELRSAGIWHDGRRLSSSLVLAAEPGLSSCHHDRRLVDPRLQGAAPSPNGTDVRFRLVASLADAPGRQLAHRVRQALTRPPKPYLRIRQGTYFVAKCARWAGNPGSRGCSLDHLAERRGLTAPVGA